MAEREWSIKLYLPEGWRATGEFRPPRTGEFFFDSYTVREMHANDSVGPYIIIEREWQWPHELLDETVRCVYFSKGSWWRSVFFCGDHHSYAMHGIKWNPPPEIENKVYDNPKYFRRPDRCQNESGKD